MIVQSEDYEELIYDQEDIYEEVEEPLEKKQKPNTYWCISDAKITQPSVSPAPTIITPSFDAIEYFCLSLSEPLRQMDFMSQQRAKEKIYSVINAELEISFSSTSNV